MTSKIEKNQINIKKTLLYSLLVIVIAIVFVYFFFVINGFIPLGKNLVKSDWLLFAGSFLGGAVGGIIAFIGVFMTIKSNERKIKDQVSANSKNVEKQIEANKELLFEQLRLQNKPVLVSVLSVGKDSLLAFNTVVRDLFFIDDATINYEWRVAKDKINLDRIIYPYYSCLTLKNSGNGTAFKISIKIKKIIKFQGLNQLDDFTKRHVNEPYEKCQTNNYKRVEDKKVFEDDWYLFTEFSLAQGESINFVFNHVSQKNEFTLLDIQYEDSFGVVYKQKVIIINYDKTPMQYPISKVYE